MVVNEDSLKSPYTNSETLTFSIMSQISKNLFESHLILFNIKQIIAT